MESRDLEGALRKTRRPVIDPENVWTYLPMILIYMVFLVALIIYRIGLSWHPWLAPGVVLFLIFVLVILAGAKVDDWWISNGGVIPSNILLEYKLECAERAKRTVELYTPMAIVTFWLAYGLFFHAGAEMLVPELMSNAASLVVFLLVGATNFQLLRKNIMVVVGISILIVAISLFVPGPASLASIANIVVSLHKVTAFSLLYLLTEISNKLRRSPLRNGYSASHVKKLVQTAWILFAGRFVSLLGWVQIVWVIWILQKQFQRSTFISNRRKAEKIEKTYLPVSNDRQSSPQTIDRSFATTATSPNSVSAPVAYHHQSNGIISGSVPSPLPTTSHSVGRIVSNQTQSYSTKIQSPVFSSSQVSNRGMSGRSRYPPRVVPQTGNTKSSRTPKQNHRRKVATPGGSPLDQYGNDGI